MVKRFLILLVLPLLLLLGRSVAAQQTNYNVAPGAGIGVATNISGTNLTWTITSTNGTTNFFLSVTGTGAYVRTNVSGSNVTYTVDVPNVYLAPGTNVVITTNISGSNITYTVAVPARASTSGIRISALNSTNAIASGAFFMIDAPIGGGLYGSYKVPYSLVGGTTIISTNGIAPDGGIGTNTTLINPTVRGLTSQQLTNRAAIIIAGDSQSALYYAVNSTATASPLNWPSWLNSFAGFSDKFDMMNLAVPGQTMVAASNAMATTYIPLLQSATNRLKLFVIQGFHNDIAGGATPLQCSNTAYGMSQLARAYGAKTVVFDVIGTNFISIANQTNVSQQLSNLVNNGYADYFVPLTAGQAFYLPDKTHLLPFGSYLVAQAFTNAIGTLTASPEPARVESFTVPALGLGAPYSTSGKINAGGFALVPQALTQSTNTIRPPFEVFENGFVVQTTNTLKMGGWDMEYDDVFGTTLLMQHGISRVVGGAPFASGTPGAGWYLWRPGSTSAGVGFTDTGGNVGFGIDGSGNIRSRGSPIWYGTQNYTDSQSNNVAQFGRGTTVASFAYGPASWGHRIIGTTNNWFAANDAGTTGIWVDGNTGAVTANGTLYANTMAPTNFSAGFFYFDAEKLGGSYAGGDFRTNGATSGRFYQSFIASGAANPWDIVINNLVSTGAVRFMFGTNPAATVKIETNSITLADGTVLGAGGGGSGTFNAYSLTNSGATNFGGAYSLNLTTATMRVASGYRPITPIAEDRLTSDERFDGAAWTMTYLGQTWPDTTKIGADGFSMLSTNLVLNGKARFTVPSFGVVLNVASINTNTTGFGARVFIGLTNTITSGNGARREYLLHYIAPGGSVAESLWIMTYTNSVLGSFTTASVNLTPPFELGFCMQQGHASAWYRPNGGVWTAGPTIQFTTNEFAYGTNEVPGLVPVVKYANELASVGTNKGMTITRFRAGEAGGVSIANPCFVTYADGTPFIRDGFAYFCANTAVAASSSGGLNNISASQWRMWKLDLATKRFSIASTISFLRGGQIFGENSGQVFYDENLKQWTVLAVNWGDGLPSAGGIRTKRYVTNADILSGVHVLDNGTDINLPTFGAAGGDYDPCVVNIQGTNWCAYMATTNATAWNSWIRGLAYTTNQYLTNWTSVGFGNDTNTVYDGSKIVKVGNTYNVIFGRADSGITFKVHSFPSFLETGTITLGTAISSYGPPHPTYMVLPEGNRSRLFLLTHDQLRWNSVDFTYGTMECWTSDQTQPRWEWPVKNPYTLK